MKNRLTTKETAPLNKKKIILVKGTAGLGNRILSLLTAILYAQLSNRTLVIDWRDPYYSTDKTNSFNDFFMYDNKEMTVSLPLSDSIAPAIWRSNLHHTVDEILTKYAADSVNHPDTWSKFSIDLSRLDYDEDILVMWSYFEQLNVMRRHFYGEWAELRGLDTKTILRKLMRDHLCLKPAIQKQVTQFKKDRLTRPTIGLHIRCSDKRSRISPMLKKLNSLQKKYPEIQIFLATDNSEIKQKIENNYQRVLTIPKWYPEPYTPIHVGLSDRMHHGLEALIDIYLLAECDYLILDESSSFAYVATLISNSHEKQIYNFQRGRWIPAATRHKIWILKRRLEENLFSGR